MKNRIIAAISSLLLLAGCTTTKVVPVNIPVEVQGHAITVPEKPYLPIKSLTSKSTDPEVMRAYVATVPLLDNWGTNCYLVAKALSQ